MTNTTYTKEFIQDKIKTDTRWTIRSLEVLYSYQTTDEQQSEDTIHKNGQGFNGRDSKILSSFYIQVESRKKWGNTTLLSDKQLSICRKLLPKYWKQIQSHILSKQQ